MPDESDETSNSGRTKFIEKIDRNANISESSRSGSSEPPLGDDQDLNSRKFKSA